jgi:hypothetical protein
MVLGRSEEVVMRMENGKEMDCSGVSMLEGEVAVGLA